MKLCYADLMDAVESAVLCMESFACTFEDGIEGVAECGEVLINRDLTLKLTGEDGYTNDLLRCEVLVYQETQGQTAYQFWATILTKSLPRPSFGVNLGPNVSGQLSAVAAIN